MINRKESRFKKIEFGNFSYESQKREKIQISFIKFCKVSVDLMVLGST